MVKRVVVDKETGHEFRGYPFAKALGDIYFELEQGVDEQRAKNFLHELVDYKSCHETHHENPTTLEQINRLKKKILFSKHFPIKNHYSPDNEVEEKNSADSLVLGNVIVAKNIQEPNKKGGDKSFVPLEGYRVFIQGDVKEGDKVELVGRTSIYFFKAIPYKSKKSNGGNAKKSSSFGAKNVLLPEKENDSSNNIDRRYLRCAAQNLNNLVEEFDAFISPEVQEKLRKENKNIEQILYFTFKAFEKDIGLEKKIPISLHNCEDFHKYKQAYSEVVHRYKQAKPMIDAYLNWLEKNSKKEKPSLSPGLTSIL